MRLKQSALKSSQDTLVSMVICLAVLIVALALNAKFLIGIYFGQQSTSISIVINGLVVLLFVLGIGKIVRNLLFYRKQEIALNGFIKNDDRGATDPVRNLDSEALIVTRYHTMSARHAEGNAIDQGALSAILVAQESSRISLPRFIHNILILAGVFGSILSLLIALIGAPDLLLVNSGSGGMKFFIQGLSTALSTTVTAIVCFIFFGYFHIRSADIQTKVISNIEHITLERLVPRFQVVRETVNTETARLVHLLNAACTTLSKAQAQTMELHSEEVAQQIAQQIAQQNNHLDSVNRKLQDVLETLRQGFRLDQPPKQSLPSKADIPPKNVQPDDDNE